MTKNIFELIKNNIQVEFKCRIKQVFIWLKLYFIRDSWGTITKDHTQTDDIETAVRQWVTHTLSFTKKWQMKERKAGDFV